VEDKDGGFTYLGLYRLQTRPVWELGQLEMFRAVQEVREIEVGGVVANDDIRVDFLQKVAPLHQHLALVAE